MKPEKLLNLTSGDFAYDSLHKEAKNEGICTRNICKGSTMYPKRVGTQPRSKETVREMAKDFMKEYYQNMKMYPSHQHRLRWEQVSNEIEATGTYELSFEELFFGAKQAWRNAPRCIGRIQWSKLKLFDARHVTTATEMFECLLTHIRYGTNQGNIRSAITVFPQRTDGKHDFRVWNNQLFSYAGYRCQDGSIIGDPGNVEFTEVCHELGWEGKGGRFDILPLLLSANGQEPEWFEIPTDVYIEIDLIHPRYDWFADLNLRWYTMPAVAGLLFDCGGLEFPGSPFNGWYMASEIGARNLCDTHRYNILEDVGLKMGLNTSSNMSLWRDKALVEVNCAVLHSFQKSNVTIVDHHTAAETFMKHFENEQKLRGGCPADWVWIVPPISGSITPVFHQEMSLYYLKPSYEYQEATWKTVLWNKKKQVNGITKKRLSFKAAALAVKFASHLFGKALSKRVKATILYATETGKSESFAKKLDQILGHMFNSQVRCMNDYDVTNVEKETLVFIVASTFGNGDPPENGEVFSKNLSALKMRITNGRIGKTGKFRFAVFALGSSAYPNYCSFGKYIDGLLQDLGGDRLMAVSNGDALSGQERHFKQWTYKIFKLACESYSLVDEATMLRVTTSLKAEPIASSNDFKFAPVPEEASMVTGLSKVHRRNIDSMKVVSSKSIHDENEEDSHRTQQVIFETNGSEALAYQPGDHVAIIPKNHPCLVNKLLEQILPAQNPDQPIQIMVLNKVHTPNGLTSNWQPYQQLPAASIRSLLTQYLDITTPPTSDFLLLLAGHAKDNKQKTRLKQLASNNEAYNKWRLEKYPNLPEVFDEFPSIQIGPALLLSQLPQLQPRLYSVSSAPHVHKRELHVTVAVVIYRTEGGKGKTHFGVCSNYLKDLQPGHDVEYFLRSATNFHLPKDPSLPVIMVGPGTGIAPFRSFWNCNFYRQSQGKDLGDMYLFFGCRTKALDLYRDEKEEMAKLGVIKGSFLALSREPTIPKTYVQDNLDMVGSEVYKKLVGERGHFYVCGDYRMAECVSQKLKTIIQDYGKMTEEEADKYVLNMRDENRYHEDIFGITMKMENTANKPLRQGGSI